MYLIGFVKANYTKFMEFKSIYGLITSDVQERFERAKQTKSHARHWARFTMDCWLTTIYEKIWCKRCKELKNIRANEEDNSTVRPERPERRTGQNNIATDVNTIINRTQ